MTEKAITHIPDLFRLYYCAGGNIKEWLSAVKRHDMTITEKTLRVWAKKFRFAERLAEADARLAEIESIYKSFENWAQRVYGHHILYQFRLEDFHHGETIEEYFNRLKLKYEKERDVISNDIEKTEATLSPQEQGKGELTPQELRDNKENDNGSGT